jgi:hypothetical protein
MILFGAPQVSWSAWLFPKKFVCRGAQDSMQYSQYSQNSQLTAPFFGLLVLCLRRFERTI